MRVAVVGGGLGGVSVAHELLAQARGEIQVRMLDWRGRLAAGASGVAAGLLHPFSPRGKLLWNAELAMHRTEALVARAEAHDPGTRPSAGLLKPARNGSEVLKLHSLAENSRGWASAVDETRALALAPGLLLPEDVLTARTSQSDPVALYIPNGSALNTARYLNALWAASQSLCEYANAIPGKSGHLHEKSLSLEQHNVERSEELEHDHDAVVFACGAEALSIPESSDLPISLEGGWVCDLDCSNSDDAIDMGGLLGQPYVVPQGGGRFSIGSTHEKNTSLETAIRETGEYKDAPEAESHLRAKLSNILPGFEKESQSMSHRYGVRAQAPRNSLGALPIVRERKRGVIDICGFGARGLVYHALVAHGVASAIVKMADRSLVDEVPNELIR